MTPNVLDDVSASVGYTATRILQGWYGGAALWVPVRVDAGHPLVALIGWPAFRLLVRDFAGMRIMMPTDANDRWVKRYRQIAELMALGNSTDCIADVVGLKRRRVQQIVKENVLRGWLEFVRGPDRKRWRIPTEILRTSEGFGESPPGAAAEVDRQTVSA